MGQKTEASNTSVGSSSNSGVFVFVQQLVAKELQTFIEFPPMQRGASFTLDAVKREWQQDSSGKAASKGPSN